MKAGVSQLSRGFSLVEVTMAIGITAFCLIALIGLLPTGLVALRDGTNEEAASDLLARVCLDITEASPETTVRFYNEGGETVPTPEDARFRVEITPREGSRNPRLKIWHITVVHPPLPDASIRTRVETLVSVHQHP